MTRVRAVLGIGSNLDRRRHIGAGVEALRERFGKVVLSPVYSSPSAGFDGPDFYNLAAIVETELSVDDLQSALREIEASQGRTRDDDAFVSRTLDIDILLYGNAVMRANGYDIPREEILHFAFVLKPLADLLPAEAHPESGQTFDALWREFASNHDTSSLSKSSWTP